MTAGSGHCVSSHSIIGVLSVIQRPSGNSTAGICATPVRRGTVRAQMRLVMARRS
jgi:hypothetical protein